MTADVDSSSLMRDTEAAVLSWPVEQFRCVLGAAMIAASTDKDHPVLCSVQIRRVNGRLTIVGTDGHWLLRWTEAEGATNEFGDLVDRSAFECKVPRHVAESFLAATKTKEPLELERVLLHGSDQRWRLSTIIDSRIHEFLQIAEAYPDVEKVIPHSVAPVGSGITVGAKLLARVSKAFGVALGDAETPVYWQMSGGPMDPIVCTSPEHPEIIAVVMPRRGEAGESALPEAKAEKEKR